VACLERFLQTEVVELKPREKPEETGFFAPIQSFLSQAHRFISHVILATVLLSLRCDRNAPTYRVSFAGLAES
jgi:hypothetical protein